MQPDPLDRVLDRWSEPPEPSSRLVATIWQRIATQETSTPPARWKVFVSWFDHPALTAAFVAACVLVGLFFAELRVSHMQRERSAQLAHSYLLLIDPLLNTPPGDRRS